MKTSLTKLKSSLSLTLVLLTLPVLAKPVAQVTEVGGQVFVISPDGKTKSLKVNDHIEEKSELLVDEGATITLNDYYNATYHMIGGSHVKIFDKSVQLKRGKTWIQSQNSRYPLSLTTANGQVNYWKGEFITTFDMATSRTQVLVVNGEVEVSNILDANLKYVVAAGTFSLIDPEVDSGSPRTPVKVGLNSLNSALAEFKMLPEKIKDTAPHAEAARAIASVEDEAVAPVKKGEIIFMTAGRTPASVSGEAHKYFKKKASPSLAKTKMKESLSAVEIKYYGMSWKPVVAASPVVITPREPASIAVKPSYQFPKNLTKDLIPDTEFGASLKKHSDEQPKYSKELDSLILDLKSY